MEKIVYIMPLLITILSFHLFGCTHEFRNASHTNIIKEQKMEDNNIYTLGLGDMIDIKILEDTILNSDLILEGNLNWHSLRDDYVGTIEIKNILKGKCESKKIAYKADPGLNIANYSVMPLVGIWFLNETGGDFRLNTICPGIKMEEKDRVMKLIKNDKF